MSDATEQREPQLREPVSRARPRWWLAVPLAIVAGAAIGVTAPSVPRIFSPPAGAPDSLRALRIPVPSTPAPPTRYISRVVNRESPRELQIRQMALRYNITGTMSRSIHEVAEEVGIDPELGFRLVRVESVFDPDAFNPAGGMGLTQLMPSTARSIDPKVRTRRQIMEPRTNLRLGFINLRNMLELFDGDVRLAVIAYNRGEVAVQRAVKRGRDPENGYGKLVLGAKAHGGKPYAGPGLMPTPRSLAADSARAAAEKDDG